MAQVKRHEQMATCYIPTKMLINCQGNITEIILTKTGILTLQPTCKVYTKNTIIYATKNFDSNYTKDYIPEFQLEKDINGKPFIENIKKIQFVNNNSLTAMGFGDLQKNVKSLEWLNKEVEDTIKLENTHNTNNFQTIVIGTITIGVLIFTYTK